MEDTSAISGAFVVERVERVERVEEAFAADARQSDWRRS
jgi:hypothetical protein